jgi:thiamine pyrophosphokinase
MDALVVGAAPETGGEAFYRTLLAAAPLVIAADAGAEWSASLGRMPDVALGDFDSAAPGAAERLAAAGVDVRIFPVAKDASDLDLAVVEARARGAVDVVLTACTSQRLDHTLAALGALASAADLRASIDEPALAAWALEPPALSRLDLDGSAGALVSVFAVAPTAEGVTLRGMRFPLDDARLEPLSSHGLSNELVGGPASVSVCSGRLLVLAPGVPGVRARRAG